MTTQWAFFGYISANCSKPLGEFIDLGSSDGYLSLLSGLVSVIAIGLYLLFERNAENDDDDSDSGGGGLMQPVT